MNTQGGIFRPRNPKVIVGMILIIAAVAGTTWALDTPPNASERPNLNASFSHLPLYFIENQGQVDGQVAYYVMGSEMTLYFSSDGLTFALEGNGNDEIKRWAVKLGFVGANSVRPRGEDKQEAVFSFFKGRVEDWKTEIPAYRKLVYESLWPGIDLVYSGTMDQLKYEFVVTPGADPSQIRLSYEGAEDVSVTDTCALEVRTGLKTFEDGAPYAYQNRDGRKKNVPVRYSLDKKKNNAFTCCFVLGSYDPDLPLVIDPFYNIFCGYIGGSSSDHIEDIALDDEGNVYVTGSTRSDELSFPVIVGPDLTFNGGTYDLFVAKVKADGSALEYCGYISGDGDEVPAGIAVDDDGCAYVVGDTGSTESTFPVITGPDLTYNGDYFDSFIAKVSADGTHLEYCGYVGGAYQDEALGGVALDGSGNAYLSGMTESDEKSFPVVLGPDLTHNGLFDAYVAKVNPQGTGLVYCGYLGGKSQDEIWDMAVTENGTVYVTGATHSNEMTFPVLAGPDLSYNGLGDAFIARIQASGTALDYCGYLGGEKQEECRGIAIDNQGNAYVTGKTESDETSFPVMVGPDLTYNEPIGYPFHDAFVAKIVSHGTSLAYCGYIGGKDEDNGFGIDVDPIGNAYITGSTSSNENSFPVAVGPDLTINGGQDVFLAKVRNDGSALEYCGYIGGTGVEVGMDIERDTQGHIYIGGSTSSDESSFPVTKGPDLSFNGSTDAFLLKMQTIDFWYVDGGNMGGPWDGTKANPFQYIQDGIGAATDEDVIIVLPGTYNENIDFDGKAVTVSSEEGPEGTLIDGQGSGSVVVFNSGEGLDSILSGFTIRNGHAGSHGGGIYCSGASPTLENNIIENNRVTGGGYMGGGIFCYNGSPAITGNIIRNNSSEHDGGGIYCQLASPELINNFVVGNTAHWGAGLYCYNNCFPTLTNNTFCENMAMDASNSRGGGIFSTGSCHPVVTNCIFWDNYASYSDPEIYSGNITVNYCDVEGGHMGTGNIDADPGFIHPPSKNFRLGWPSPCIDTGDNDAPYLPELDFYGDPRIVDGDHNGSDIVDMGCDEFHPIRVPEEYSHIQDAIISAKDNSVVLVWPGFYWENINFMGKAVAVISLDDAFHTYIDGMAEDHTVIFENGEGSGSVLADFTIANGHGLHGGGIYCVNGSSPVILRNRIDDNAVTGANSYGGGIYISASSPILDSNTIKHNSSEWDGGGIYCTQSSPLLVNNFIHKNTSLWGAAMYFTNSSFPVLINNTITENEATGASNSRGGGLFTTTSCHPVIKNTIFWGNTASYQYPQIYCPSGNITVSYSDVEGGYPGTCILDKDPGFIGAGGMLLAASSPCINRGTNEGAPSTDEDGEERPHMGTADMGGDEFTGNHYLEADNFEVSESAGGTINFAIKAGTANAYRNYLILGSVTGTVPGSSLPGNHVTIPINWDSFTYQVINLLGTPIFQNFLGSVDGTGSTSAALVLPPIPGSAGLILYFAYAMNNPWNFVSNPVAIYIGP